jgi:hypothetical protein
MAQATSHPTVTEEVAEFLARGPSADEIAGYRISERAQERVRVLMERNDEGTLTPEESAELDVFTLIDQLFTLIRARRASQAHESPSQHGNA